MATRIVKTELLRFVGEMRFRDGSVFIAPVYAANFILAHTMALNAVRNTFSDDEMRRRGGGKFKLYTNRQWKEKKTSEETERRLGAGAGRTAQKRG